MPINTFQEGSQMWRHLDLLPKSEQEPQPTMSFSMSKWPNAAKKAFSMSTPLRTPIPEKIWRHLPLVSQVANLLSYEE
jgi:hypothetical protein